MFYITGNDADIYQFNFIIEFDKTRTIKSNYLEIEVFEQISIYP
jgi:hypothetical protein